MAEPIVHELSLPPDVVTSGGQEVLRAFIIEGELHVALTNAFERPAVWGRLLVDVAHHIARMYSQEGTGLRDQALSEIYQTLQSEWSLPDDHSDTIN